MPTLISDLASTVPLKYVRQRTVRSDRASIALGSDGQAFLRCHEKLADRNINFLLPIRRRPFIALSFKTEMLAPASATVFRDLGNISPPRDGRRRAILIRNLVEYCTGCSGAGELSRAPWHYGLNQRPIVLNTENHRSGLARRLMEGNPFIIQGLRRAGFAGGWQ